MALRIDDVLANHGAYNGRGTALSILGDQFDKRRRQQYTADRAQAPGYTEFDRSTDMGLQIRNDMDSAGPWGGFFGRMGAQQEEAEAGGGRYSQVMPSLRGTPMPGNAPALRGLSSAIPTRGAAQMGGDDAYDGPMADPRVQRDMTTLLLQQLEDQISGRGARNARVDADLAAGSARENARLDAMAGAGTAETIDQQYAQPRAIRHAQTGQQVADIGQAGAEQRFFRPGAGYMRSEALHDKMAPEQLRSATDLGVAELGLEGREATAEASLQGQLIKAGWAHNDAEAANLIRLLSGGYQEGNPLQSKNPAIKAAAQQMLQMLQGGGAPPAPGGGPIR